MARPGRDDEFGWGRIDMRAAVAADTPPAPPPGCLAESSHPYSNNLDQTWTITNPDTDVAISRVHFSRLEAESSYDFVKVKDGDSNIIQTFSGSYAGGVWSAPVPGRTVQIQLLSDYIVSAWGFCVDQIETVAYAPDIDVPVAPISVRLGPGRTTDRTLVIGNTGRGALDFSLSVADATTPGSGIPESGMEAPATSEEASVSVAPFRLVHADGDILKASPSQASAPQGASASPSGSWGLGAPLSASRYRFAGVTDNRRRYFAIGGSDSSTTWPSMRSTTRSADSLDSPGTHANCPHEYTSRIGRRHALCAGRHRGVRLRYHQCSRGLRHRPR